jgi:hypothetical protein
MRRLNDMGLFRVSLFALLASPLLWAGGCGGKTDIDFQGYDSGVSGSSTGGSTNTGGTVNTGGGGDGGVANVGGGGDGGVGNVSGGGTGGGVIVDGGVVCGGVVCPPPSLPIGQVDSCCAGDKCGLTSSFLGGQCVELGQAGVADPTCPQQTFQGIPLSGCCKPTGVCGVLDTFLGLGCVDPSQFGGPPSPACGGGGSGGTGGTAGTGGTGGTSGASGQVDCGSNQNPGTCAVGEQCCILAPGLDYCDTASATCQCTNNPNCAITPATCDGPEDCPGQICCGTFSQAQNQYVSLACQSSCSGQFEREICHPNGSCTGAGTTCSQSSALPGYIWRCN